MNPDLELVLPVENPISLNSYRILGLPGEVSEPEILEAADRACRPDGMGAYATSWDIPWLGPPERTSDTVQRAVERLGDPVHRLHDRLFWFHEQDAEDAVAYLTPATLSNAAESWASTTMPLASHDAAVVALLTVLTLDQEVHDAPRWRSALERWKAVLEAEDYWLATMQIEMEGGFENAASLGEIREIRESSLALVAGVVLDQARSAITEKDLATAGRALVVLQDALDEPLFEEVCAEMAGVVWGQFDAKWSRELEERQKIEESQKAEDWEATIESAAAMSRGEPPSPREEEEEKQVPAGSNEVVVEPEETPVEVSEPLDTDGLPEAAPAKASEATVEESGEDHEIEPVETDPPGSEMEPDEEVGEPVTEDEEPTGAHTPEAIPKEPEEDEIVPLHESPSRSTLTDQLRRLRHSRPVTGTAAAAVISLLLVTLVSGVGSKRSTGPPAEVAPVAQSAPVPEDPAVIRLRVRHEALLSEIHYLEDAIEGYRQLVDDYHFRMENRLTVNEADYQRVLNLHNQLVAQLTDTVEERDRVAARLESLWPPPPPDTLGQASR
jgi:hypothetical protein